jgi:hypothetical protein
VVRSCGTVDSNTTPGFDSATAKYESGCDNATKVVIARNARFDEQDSPTLSKNPATIKKDVNAQMKKQSE